MSLMMETYRKGKSIFLPTKWNRIQIFRENAILTTKVVEKWSWKKYLLLVRYYYIYVNLQILWKKSCKKITFCQKFCLVKLNFVFHHWNSWKTELETIFYRQNSSEKNSNFVKTFFIHQSLKINNGDLMDFYKSIKAFDKNQKIIFLKARETQFKVYTLHHHSTFSFHNFYVKLHRTGQV